ncbi:15938_t:CDS:2, partial [Dentiscutata heterogama]
MTRLSKRKVHLWKFRVQKKTKNQHQIKALRTYSSSDEPSDVEDSDVEISILEDEEANSIITRLLLAVLIIGHLCILEIRKEQEAAVGTSKLELFWLPRVDTYMSDGVDMNDEPIGSDSDSENDFEIEAIRDHNIMSSEILNSKIEQLKEEIKSDKYSEVEKACLYTMLSYLHLVEHGRQRVEASIIVAEAARKGAYHARCIRSWTINYILNRTILISRQGKHPKTWSFLWDDDILIQIKSFLRSNKWCVNANELAKHVNEKILPGLCFDLSLMIYVRTAKKWLKTFGFEYSEVRKEMYMDRHERADVVAYHEKFLKKIEKYEMHMIIFSGENMEEEIRPATHDIIILVTYDEKSVHISEFLTDVGGCLTLSEENKNYKDSKLPKSLKEVLRERGLWHDRMKLVYKGG